MASAATSGIQLHTTHGFLLIRIECLGVARIDPLVHTALIKAALRQPGRSTAQMKVGCSRLDTASLGQGDRGSAGNCWRRGDGTEDVHHGQEPGERVLPHPTAAP